MLLWAIVAALCGAGVLWGIFGGLLFSDYRDVVEDASVTGGEIDTEAREAVRQAEALIREHAGRAR